MVGKRVVRGTSRRPAPRAAGTAAESRADMSSEPRFPDDLLEELQSLRRRVAELERLQFDDNAPGEGRDVFRRLVEHSLGLMCVHDLEGNLLFVNAAAALTLGF